MVSEKNQPPPEASELLQSFRDPGRNLKNKYRIDPIGLAERLGLKLPKKPAQRMVELGIYDEERDGPIIPGLRDLVTDICLGIEESAVAVANRGGGKAGSIEIPVPTPLGWKRLGDIQVGDEVFDDQGNPCRVVKAFPVLLNRPCSEIVFSDHSSMIVDDEHLWLTSTAASRHADKHCIGGSLKPQQKRSAFASVKTTDDIRKTLKIKAGKGRVDCQHQVLNTAPLQMAEQDLPVDPYLLGLWLGDGDAQQVMVSVGNQDIEFSCAQFPIAEKVPDTNGNWRLRMAHLNADFRSLRVLRDKHVPAIYLRGSEQQRRDLLAGLMDSDGTTRASSNNCQFDNTNENLSDAVYELVVSLGWKATRSKKIGKLYGVEHKLVHRVSFRPTQQIFRNPRKAERLDFSVSQASRHLNRVVRDVRQVASVPVRCIEVDSPSHLFLWGNQMIPTHNSQGVSFIEFFLVMIRDFDALNLGGSELQADQVYRYFLAYIESDPYWKTLLKGETQQSRTETIEDAWIRVLTASSKSVRSPHAGGRKKSGRMAGGVLVIDEEVETDPEIVHASLHTINTAQPSVNVRCSTFHNLHGTFAEVVDNHEEMGYKFYNWNIFDVAIPCSCAGVCQNPEPCFREDHTEKVFNQETGEEEERLLHRAYCGGKAMYADGWIPMEEILKLWRRLKRNHERWEVEAMGSRPSTSGYVIKDQKSYNHNIDAERAVYIPGSPVTVCVDWGRVAAGLSVWQEQFGDNHVLLEAEEIHEAGQSQIFSIVLGKVSKYGNDFIEVAADIGGGGSYLNPKLREDHGLEVRDVNFNQEKEAAVAAWNIFNEDGKCAYPVDVEEFHHQVRSWRRAHGEIRKGNDHLCDSGVCYFSKFIERLGLSKYRVAPRGFSTGGAPTPKLSEPLRGEDMTRGRAPVVVSIGGARRGGWRS